MEVGSSFRTTGTITTATMGMGTTTGTRMGFVTVAAGVMDFLTSRIIIISAITLALAMAITVADRGEVGRVPVEPPEVSEDTLD